MDTVDSAGKVSRHIRVDKRDLEGMEAGGSDPSFIFSDDETPLKSHIKLFSQKMSRQINERLY